MISSELLLSKSATTTSFTRIEMLESKDTPRLNEPELLMCIFASLLMTPIDTISYQLSLLKSPTAIPLQ